MQRDALALKVSEVYKKFGGIEALRGVNLQVHSGDIFGVIGPNGAGKTVLLNIVNGIYPPDSGRILLNGRDVTGLPPHQIATLGVARTFQITKVFPEMTVLQNILVALHVARPELYRDKVNEMAYKALELTGLEKMAYGKARALSGGQKKLLEFARGLASGAQLYLMDEPFAGVNPVIVNKMLELMKLLSADGGTIVVVSHEIGVISKICNKVAVLDRGQVVAEGPLREVVQVPRVREIYLGR